MEATLERMDRPTLNAWTARLPFGKANPVPRVGASPMTVAISRPSSRSSTATTDENTDPQRAIPVDEGDSDPTNTRLFIKSLSPNLLNYEEVYRIFRPFGPVKMIALQTKRHNVLVEFANHDSALNAKRSCQCVHELSGKTYTIRIHWGKIIKREPPVKNPVPNAAQQIEFCKAVDAEIRRRRTLHLPIDFHSSLEDMLSPDIVTKSMEEFRKSAEAADPDMPPGIITGPSTAQIFSLMDVDPGNVGLMPLRTNNWFEGCIPPTSAFSRVSQPTKPCKTVSIVFKSGLKPLLSSSEPWANFDTFEVNNLPLSQDASDTLTASSKHEWELNFVDSKFGTPTKNKMSPSKEAAVYVPSYVSSPESSPSSSLTSLSELLQGFREWQQESKVIKPAHIQALGVEDFAW